MTVASEFLHALDHAYADALRGIMASHPSMTAADLRALLAAHPELESLTLDELFGESSRETHAKRRPKQGRRVRTGSKSEFPIRQPFVGQLVRKLRKQAGLTRAALSDAVDVTSSAIVRLEAGGDVRLSSYLPIIEYFVIHEPQAWMIAEQTVLLTAPERAELLASLDALDPAAAR